MKKTDAAPEQTPDTKKEKTVDLGSLDIIFAAEKGADMHVLHPVTGEELGIIITLIGTDSETHRKNLRRLTSSRLNRKGRKPMSSEEAEEEALELLVGGTLGWKGAPVVVDGVEVSFDRAAAKMLYKRFPWIREQADMFMCDRGNFLGD